EVPALDADEERRGRPSVWAAYGEATAILVGDALVAEAFRLALSSGPEVARELVEATLGMIGGQQMDLEGGHDLAELHRLKTGALFSASVMCGVWAAGALPGPGGVGRGGGGRAGAGAPPRAAFRRRARAALPGRRRHPRRRRLRRRGGRGEGARAGRRGGGAGRVPPRHDSGRHVGA